MPTSKCWIGSPLLALLAACSTTDRPHDESHETHWNYTELGPELWATLDPEFATCGAGKLQSPIDIGSAIPGNATSIQASFRPAELHIVHHEHRADIVNTGHSIQVDYPESDTLVIGDERYALLQYHFHSPGEHQVSGRGFPAEVHFVHRSQNGRLAVIGVLVEEGAANTAYDPVLQNLPTEKNHPIHLDHVMIDVDALLPAETSSVRYLGSLTTPPCSETVEWIVMTTPATMSSSQLAALGSLLSGNARPVQAAFDRPVILDRIPELGAR